MLAGLGFLSFGTSALYCTRGHPEVTFFRDAWRVKRAWGSRPAVAGQPRAVICGGSSAAFGIIPRQIEAKYGVPTVNMGLHAGFGPRLLTRVALREARSGDVLVLAIEPKLLVQEWDQPALGVQFAMASGLGGLLDKAGDGWRVGPDLTPYLALRPGAWHTLVLAGRTAARKPLGRYLPGDLSTDGWMQTPIRWQVPSVVGKHLALSMDARTELRSVAEWGRTNNVTVVYALPWAYSAASDAAGLRASNLGLLREIAGIMPVIAGGNLGAVSDPGRFLDSEWHLDAKGAEARSDELGEALRSRRFLSASDLDRPIQTPPAR